MSVAKFSVSFEENLLARIDEERGFESRSAWLARAAEEMLPDENGPPTPAVPVGPPQHNPGGAE